jgi:hypothetical protein
MPSAMGAQRSAFRQATIRGRCLILHELRGLSTRSVAEAGAMAKPQASVVALITRRVLRQLRGLGVVLVAVPTAPSTHPES